MNYTMKQDTYSGLGKDFASQRDLLYSALEQQVAGLNLPFQEVRQGIVAKATDALYNVDYLGRKDFVNSYKEGRLKHEISKAKGNLTQVTRNLYGVDDPDRINVLRKNVDDHVKQFGLRDYVDQKRPWKETLGDRTSYRNIPEPQVTQALTSGLSAYQGIIHPKVYASTQQKILDHASKIAEAVAPLVPTRQTTIDYLIRKTEHMTWDESIRHVEELAVKEALKNAQFDKKKAAKYLGSSVKTVDRKIQKFRLDKKLSEFRRLSDLVKRQGVGQVDKDAKPSSVPKDKMPSTQAEYFQTVAAEYDLAA